MMSKILLSVCVFLGDGLCAARLASFGAAVFVFATLVPILLVLRLLRPGASVLLTVGPFFNLVGKI